MKNELNQIQWLRGIAALLVVFTHFTGKAFSVKMINFQFEKGAIGVDVFFIISGFIMMYVASRKKQQPSTFLLNRAVRILPVHYLFLIPLFIVYLINPGIVNSSVDKTYVWQSFLLIPMDRDNAEYLNPVIWTLCYEAMFYLIFSISLFYNSLMKSFISTSITILILSFIGVLYKGSDSFIIAVTDSISIEFIIGMFIYVLYDRKLLRINFIIPLLVAILLYLSLLNIDAPRFVKDGFPSAFLFVSFLNMPNIKIRPLNFLGKISYEIYVCHIMSIAVSYQIIKRLGIDNVYVYFILTLAVIFIVSTFVNYIFKSRKLITREANIKIN